MTNELTKEHAIKMNLSVESLKKDYQVMGVYAWSRDNNSRVWKIIEVSEGRATLVPWESIHDAPGELL